MVFFLQQPSLLLLLCWRTSFCKNLHALRDYDYDYARQALTLGRSIESFLYDYYIHCIYWLENNMLFMGIHNFSSFIVFTTADLEHV